MPKSPKSSSRVKLQGKVVAFNISPKGQVEGALVGIAQVNFPKNRPEPTPKSMRVGAKVDLHAEVESDEGAHPVYRVVDEDAEIRGSIVRLNYALHGEVNGYHLDDGTFLHVKPEGARKYKLHVGEKVRAIGSRRAGKDAVVLEVSALKHLVERDGQNAQA